MGRKRALARATFISAADAERIGLVNRVVPHDEILAEALRLTGRIGEHAPSAVASCLFAVTRGINHSIDEGLAIEAAEFERAASGDAVRAGLDAFIRRGGSR